MRTVSPELAAAIEASVRPLRVTGSIDWDGDGHGGPGTIDDISGRLGDLTITRALTGQLPAEVLVVEGISAGTASSNLVKGLTDDESMAVVQYFSRLNPDSPLYGKLRAGRNARLDIELLTSAGWQSVPLLVDGVLRSLPVSVKDRRASLNLIDARDRFRTPVELPAFVAEEAYDGVNLPSSPGLEAGWVVSYALWKAGYPLSPPARSGAALWIPAHGSMMPFVGKTSEGGPTICYTRPNSPVLSDIRRVVFDEGPHFLAPTTKASDTNPTNTMQGLGDPDGTAIFTSAGQSSGRIEFWAKIPASPSTADLAAEVIAVNTGASAAAGYGSSDPQASLAIRRDGVARLRLDASTGAAITVTVTGPTYTHDGGWHLFGVHWDSATGAATFYRDGVTNSVPFTPQAAGDPAITTVTGYTVNWLEPISEIQITGGLLLAAAWQPQTWDAGVVVDRPQNRRLMGCYPDGPVQAWTLLQQVYGAERGLVWIDQDGVPQLWTAARANMPDALTPVRTVTSKRDILSLGYDDRRDMVRNIIRATYAEISILPSAVLWALSTLVRIEPSQTWTTTIALDKPIVSPPVLTGTAAPNGIGDPGTYVAITATGTVRGTVTTTGQTLTVTVTNLTASTVWLLDVNGDPDLTVTAQTIERASPVTVEVRDQASIDAYGDSPLDVPQNPWSQTRGWALGRAYALLALLRHEQIVYTDIEIPGDPRLDPLDRLQVVDEHGLMLDTEVALLQRSDAISGGRYNSTLVARPALDQWILGGVGVGTPLGETILGGTP